MSPLILKLLVCAATALPLLFLVRRPVTALRLPENQTYGLVVSPLEEGVLYVEE